MTTPAWLQIVNGHTPMHAADYVNQRFYAHGSELCVIGDYFDASRYSFDRDCIATYRNAAGVLQMVGNDVPRLTSSGLMLEGTVTNLAKYSNDTTNAVWAHGNSGSVNGAATGPDGNNSGFSLKENAANTWHDVYQQFTITAGQPYCASGFVKMATREARVWVTKGGENFFANPNLAAGTVSPAATTGTAVSVPLGAYLDSYANGWYRNAVSGKFTNQTSCWIDMNCRNVGAPDQNVYPGDGSSLAYGFGLQFETGLFPSSYIPTNSTTATRLRDSLVRKNSSTIQAITKRIKFCTAPGLPVDYQVLYHLDNNSAGGDTSIYADVEIYRDANGHLWVVVTNNPPNETAIDFGVFPDNTVGTIAFSASAAGINASLNGGVALSSLLTVSWPTNLIYERLGHNMVGDRSWFGTVLEDATWLEAADVTTLQSISS